MSTAIGAVGTSGSGLQDIMALRQQLIERSSALQELRGLNGTNGGGAADTARPIGGGFAETLNKALGSVNETQARSREMTAAYERGEVADVAQVMLARQESSIAFEATLQVRNKLLSAYQDVMRMGV